MPIKIDYDKCCFKNGQCISCSCGGACNGCVEVCSTGALTREQMVEYDQTKCIDCGSCVEACQYQAIALS